MEIVYRTEELFPSDFVFFLSVLPPSYLLYFGRWVYTDLVIQEKLHTNYLPVIHVYRAPENGTSN